jgi:hypothetical protein
VIPLTKTFGAEIKGIELKLLTEDCAKKLREEAYMYRFLLFKLFVSISTISFRGTIKVGPFVFA